jgi:ketol-acid reductoisomerase
MTKIYGEADANPKALAGLKIAVIGYGSQGRGQALNLRDSDCNVVIGVRQGRSWKQAVEDGWKPVEPAAAVDGADMVMMLAPDMSQPKIYKEAVAPKLKPGALLMFSHGFNVLYGQVAPPDSVDVSMVAPKGPGNLVRRQYEEGRGVPCLIAVHRDGTGKAFERTLAYAHALGATRAAVLETTFAEETETDLFGEQAVLCGGVTELIVAGWETLVAAGYSPEAAYFECLHEMKLIVDLIHEGGISRMLQFVSETAKYGDLSRGTRIIDDRVRESMKKVLAEVQSGQFAKEWIAEDAAGRPRYNALLKRDLEHPIEKIGVQLRARMPWLQQKKAVSA